MVAALAYTSRNNTVTATYDVAAERAEIVRALPIYDLAARFLPAGSHFKKSGTKHGAAVYKACCPFHSEDTASFYIYEHDSTYHCYGCGAHGDSVTFLRKIENLQEGQIFKRARELAGLIRTKPAPRPRLKIVTRTAPPATWQEKAWQEFAESQLADARARFDQSLSVQYLLEHGTGTDEFEGKGITHITAKRFEIGWTGDTAIRQRVAGNTLLVPARCFIFPVRNPEGKIQMLKWRQTEKASAKKYGKYGQLTGGEGTVFNLAQAQAQAQAQSNTNAARAVILTTGEFETMLLWQITGGKIEPVCHTAGELGEIDIAGLFAAQIERGATVYYIADRDTPGRKAADARREKFPALRVAYVDRPFKDLCEQNAGRSAVGGLTIADINRFLADADSNFKTGDLPGKSGQAVRGRKRVTRKLSAKEARELLALAKGVRDTSANENISENPVELEEARELLAKEVRNVYAHPRLAKTDVLMLQAAPGVGKGHTVNAEATRTALAKPGMTTGWFGGRLDMFGDQDGRDNKTIWKLIEGRRASRDQDGNAVDFNAPEAVADAGGNCTVEGAAFHEAMAARGYERESYKYCQLNCPAREDCLSFGYLANVAKDGRNGFMTFAHMFTNLGKNYRYLVADELSYQPFVDIVEIDAGDIAHLRQFVVNANMQWIMIALLDMLSSGGKGQFKIDLMSDDDDDDGNEQEARDAEASENWAMPSAGKLYGAAFYQKLDETCRKLHKGRGLLELLAGAQATGQTYGHEFWELLAERSPKSVAKLPRNVWHESRAEPGAGGLYDIMLAEAKYALEGFGALAGENGQAFNQYISRVEFVRETPGEPAKIILHRRRYIPAELVAGKPWTVMDATGDAQLLRKLLSGYFNRQEDKELKRTRPEWVEYVPQIRTVAPQVELPKNVTVTQDTRCNYSKTALLQSIKKDPQRRYWSKFVQTVKSYLQPGVTTLIACAKAVKEYLKQDLQALGCTAQAGYLYEIEHYGNLRGSNAYKDYGCVIQAGMYMPQPEAVIRAGRALYGGDGRELDMTVRRVTRLHNHALPENDEGGGAAADELYCFTDKRLQTLWEIDREDEHLQVAHRIRPLSQSAESETAEKSIVLLFAMPLGTGRLPVHNLITNDQEATDAGKFAKKSERSLKVVERLVGVARELLARETRPYFTAQELHLAAVTKYGKGSLETVYKYWQDVVEGSSATSQVLECIAPMPKDRGFERRSLAIAVKSGISRKIIKTLIIIHEMPENIPFLPKGWRLADQDETPQDAPPELPTPVIATGNDAPRSVQGVADVWVNYLDVLKAGYDAALVKKSGNYNQKAALVRERYLLVNQDLGRLVGKHAPRPRPRLNSKSGAS